MSTKIFDISGVRLASESVGEARRGTILLAMGATASMVWWPDALVAALAAGGFQVIRFDHRDTGASTTNAPGDVRYELADLALDLVAILDAHGVERAHVVGMSLGGYVAQIAALERPARFASLTLVASEPLGITYEGEGIAPALLEHFATMDDVDWSDREASAAFLLRVAELSAGTGAPFDREAARARIDRELARTTSIRSAFNHAQIGGALPARTVADLVPPVLVIHGSDDPVIRVTAARATAKATRARLVVLEGTGHELVERDVPRVAGAILEHVTQR